MPADSGTQQQWHEYAYGTCCVLTVDRYMCLMRVFCVLYYDSSTNTVFELLPSLLTPMTRVKRNPDTIFGWRFHPKIDPLFLLEADPKTVSKNRSQKNGHFLLRIRSCKRWHKTSFVHSSRNFFKSVTTLVSVLCRIIRTPHTNNRVLLSLLIK